MSKSKIKKDFLFHLELFHRNFGSQWTLDDFPESIKKNKIFLTPYLKELEQLGIISIKEDQRTFLIIKLPSTVINLNE
jgi:hypothetical protein